MLCQYEKRGRTSERIPQTRSPDNSAGVFTCPLKCVLPQHTNVKSGYIAVSKMTRINVVNTMKMATAMQCSTVS